ncbi:MAG: protein kinase [Planctomycetes bacterium]|nr:protein kinase [Planctomycetota bacterium]
MSTPDASREKLLGEIAVFNRMISPEQLAECAALLCGADSSRPLHEVLIEKGYLRSDQVAKLLPAAEAQWKRLHPAPTPKPPAVTVLPSFPTAQPEGDRPTERTTVMPAGQQETLPGRTLCNEFKLIRLLGQGGMGAVYLGEQLSLKRPVAIKLLTPGLLDSSESVLRFEREAQLAARLQHPNIVQVHFFGKDAGRHFIVMELVEGESLAARLKRERRIPVSDAVRVALEAAKALAAAHKQGVVHRDVKPDNIFLGKDGAVKLGDFGLARSNASDLHVSVTGQIMGTLLYMPPEQCEGKPVDGRADLYALGATLFHLVTGTPPFDGESATQLLLKHLQAPIPSARRITQAVPEALDHVLHRCLEKDRERRPPTAEELIALLDRVVAGPGAARPGSSTRTVALGPTAIAKPLTPAPEAAKRVQSREPSPPRRPPVHAPTRPGVPLRTVAIALAGVIAGAGALWVAGLGGGGSTRQDSTEGGSQHVPVPKPPGPPVDVQPPVVSEPVVEAQRAQVAARLADLRERETSAGSDPDQLLRVLGAYDRAIAEVSDPDLSAKGKASRDALWQRISQLAKDHLRDLDRQFATAMSEDRWGAALAVYDALPEGFRHTEAGMRAIEAQAELARRLEVRRQEDQAKLEGLVKSEDYAEALKLLKGIVSYESREQATAAEKRIAELTKEQEQRRVDGKRQAQQLYDETYRPELEKSLRGRDYDKAARLVEAARTREPLRLLSEALQQDAEDVQALAGVHARVLAALAEAARTGTPITLEARKGKVVVRKDSYDLTCPQDGGTMTVHIELAKLPLADLYSLLAIGKGRPGGAGADPKPCMGDGLLAFFGGDFKTAESSLQQAASLYAGAGEFVRAGRAQEYLKRIAAAAPAAAAPPVNAPPAAVPPAAQPPGLVATWSFDNGAGAVVPDDTGNGNLGSLESGTYVQGVRGRALQFNGKTGQVRVSATNALRGVTAANHTLAAWIRLDGLPSYQTMFAIDLGGAGPGGDQRGLRFDARGCPVFKWVTAKGSDLLSDAPLGFGQWHHLAGVLSEGNATLYVDGVLRGSKPVVGALMGIDAVTLAGISVSGGVNGTLNGSLDEVKVWNRALSAAEIKQLFKNP